MADKGIFWNGKKYVLPQAASRIDSSALARAPLGGGAVVAIIGEMTGLIPPKTAQKVGTPSTALALIHPGSEEARLASQLVFDPSPGSGTPGASEVYLVPVNPATNAQKTFSAALVVESFIYGIPANQVRVKIENGTIGKKVTVGFGTSEEVYNNLGKESFSIQYTGGGSAATMTITPTAETHKLVTSVTGGAEGEELDLDLLAYNTIQDVVDAINANGAYNAVVLTSNPNDLSMDLDGVVGQNIFIEAAATSNLQAIIDGLAGSGYVKASRAPGATSVPSNTAGFEYLTGGANGVTTNQDWQDALDVLQTLGVNILLPLTADASLHSMVESHCSFMSGSDGKLERRVFIGGALQTWGNEVARNASVDNLKAAFKALNSDRAVHACLGSKHYDPNGRVKLYPAYITAAMYAGIAAGGFPVQPLTRKYLRCLGLETELRIEEITEIINAGGAAPIQDLVHGAGYVISRQVTTWGKNVDLYRIEFSVGQGADYIAQEVRKRHEDLIGLPGTPELDQTVINVTNAILQQAMREGIIRSYDPAKTTLRVEGTVRYIDYAAEPILPVNFIFSTYYLLPTSFTIGL